MSDCDPRALTWTGLLSYWLDVARASAALPDDEEGDAWRASMAPIINLQAVTFALAELTDEAHPERPLALDRSELLINEANATLRRVWPDDIPDRVLEIVADSRAALAHAMRSGPTELIWAGPGTMIMPALDIDDRIGTLAVMAPGTIVMPGEPVAWWADRPPVRVRGCRPVPTAAPRQVYRRMDEDGAITGDVMAPMHDTLLPGLPLLVPLLENGAPIGHFTMDPDDWLKRQRASIADSEIPVVEAAATEFMHNPD